MVPGRVSGNSGNYKQPERKTMKTKDIWRITRRQFVPLLASGLVLGIAHWSAVAQAQAGDIGGKRDVTVLTRNLYVGADFSPIVLALYQGDLLQIPTLVSTAY